MKIKADSPSLEKLPENEAARHIAQVAARLFAEQGYDATSIRNIVEAAGVARPTLYYHFRSKEGLAQALLTRPMTDFVAKLRACLTLGDDPVANLSAQMDTHFDFIREDPDRGRFFYALFFGPLASSLSSELAHFSAQIGEVFIEGVKGVVAAGVVDADRAIGFQLACRGAIVVHTMDFLYKFKGSCGQVHTNQDAHLGHQIVSDLIRGFGTSPTSQ